MKKMIKRALSLVMTLVLCVCCFSYNTADASSYSDLTSQRDKLQQQLLKINKELSSIKDETQRLSAEQKTLAERTDIVKKQIAIYQQSIEVKEDELARMQEELDTRLQSIGDTDELLKERVRAMYMSNNTSVLSTLLSANSFSEFLARSEALRQVARHDTELMTQLKAEQAAIDTAKQNVESELTTLESDKSELDSKYGELAALLQEANSQLTEQQALQEAKSDEYKQLQSDFEAIEKQIAQIASENTGSYVGGEFRWPVPGYSYISSPYGNRMHPIYHVYKFHSGIDIAGVNIYGKSVIASNSGTVAAVYRYTTGYGYYVMINHGGGIYTLYAHLSSIIVNKGDTVVKGQTIAYVGSTGASTGPHLHFEIRMNGSTVDPLDYVSSSY